jgi:8-oxo-dGTP diphosphatase
MTQPDGAPVKLRCSALVIRKDQVLLLHRDAPEDWVLPGGSPELGESSGACVRREVREETGLSVDPAAVAFVLETIDPSRQDRIIEIVMFADESDRNQLLATTEPGMTPRFVAFDELSALDLRPPIAGYLRGAVRGYPQRSAPYLGNLWRAPTGSPAGEAASSLEGGP